jgi:predicted nucleotidyltransferase
MCYYNSVMKPSAILSDKKAIVRELIARSCAINPRIFGSVVRGDDTEGSDLDLLVDTLPGTTLFDLGGPQDRLEAALGVRVDVRTPGDLAERIRARVLEEAKPL